MTELNKYLTYLDEDDKKQDLNKVKIHPKRKLASSIAGYANPVDDYVAGAVGLGAAIKTMKSKAVGPMSKAAAYGLGAAAGVAGSALAVAGYREIRSWFDSCTKTCGTFAVNTPKRQLCMLKCKQAAQQKKADLLQKKQQQKQDVTNKKIQLYRQYLQARQQKGKS